MLNWIAAHILAMFWSMFTLAFVVCAAAVILEYRVQRKMDCWKRDDRKETMLPSTVTPRGSRLLGEAPRAEASSRTSATTLQARPGLSRG
jgi:hypothetical protein